MWHHRKMDIEETTYHIREYGNSTKVLFFLHGLGWTGEIWTSLARHLDSKQYKLIAPDLAGHGKSTSAQNYLFPYLSRQLSALMDSLELDKVTLVASSWGAALAVQFAALYPSRLEHVVLLDGGYTSLKASPGLEWEMFEQNPIPVEAFESLDRYIEFVRGDDSSFWDEDIENAVKDQIYITETGKVA